MVFFTMIQNILLLSKFSKRYLLFSLLVLSLILTLSEDGKSSFEIHYSTIQVDLSSAAEEIIFVAHVRWISLEGGFYGLEAKDGRKFLPLNLPEEFRKNGLKIRVRGKIQKGIVTAYMWGTPLEILEIEILNPVYNSSFLSILT